MLENLVERIQDTSTRFGSDVAIKYRAGDAWADLLYAQLWAKVEAVAGFLFSQGLRKGDRVALLLENRYEWPVIFIATLLGGGVAVPINPEANKAEVENILNDSAATFLFTKISSVTSGLSKKCLSLKKIIFVDSDEFRDAQAPLGKAEKVGIGPADLTCILYTSGTTAQPKGVMLSHRNLLANADSLYSLKLFSAGERMISILPLHHAYPLTATLIMPLLFGVTIVYPNSLRPEDIVEAMVKTDPAVLVAVPQILYLFHNKIIASLKRVPFPLNFILEMMSRSLYWIRRKTGINLSRGILYPLHRKFGKKMRYLVSGGAKLDEKVEEDLFKYGFTVLEGYGLTETSPVLTFSPINKPKIGSVGLAIPGVSLRIEGKDEKGIGEIVASGANIMEGYYKKREETDLVLKDARFYTGDLGYFDRDGYLYITGRSKDVIVLSSGLNIYPEDVEEAYGKIPQVKEICVFDLSPLGGASEKLSLWAVIVPNLEYFRKYGEVNLRGVIKERLDNVSKTLPPYKRIMGFSIALEGLPRTLLGKVKRFAVREKILAEMSQGAHPLGVDELSQEDKALMECECGKKVIDYLRDHTKIKRQITPRDSLELDLGIDSLGRIELASGLEDEFGMTFPDEVVGSSFTVSDIIVGILGFLTGEESSVGERAHVSFSQKSWRGLFEVQPRKENREKVDLSPGLRAWLAGILFISIVRTFFRIFYGLKIEGKDNVPDKGPYILYANHASYFDGLLVAVSVPRAPRLDLFFVGFRPFFNVAIIRNLIKIGRIIPLDFSTHFLEALRSSYYVLVNGRKLCLFPEGMRTLTGEIGEFKRGFGILTKESNARLVPVILKGAYEAWPRTSAFPKFFKGITVKFGKPLDEQELEKEGFLMGATDSYSAVNAAAKKRLLELKDKR